MLVICIKQRLSNILSSIHEKGNLLTARTGNFFYHYNHYHYKFARHVLIFVQSLSIDNYNNDHFFD